VAGCFQALAVCTSVFVGALGGKPGGPFRFERVSTTTFQRPRPCAPLLISIYLFSLFFGSATPPHLAGPSSRYARTNASYPCTWTCPPSPVRSFKPSLNCSGGRLDSFTLAVSPFGERTFLPLSVNASFPRATPPPCQGSNSPFPSTPPPKPLLFPGTSVDSHRRFLRSLALSFPSS